MSAKYDDFNIFNGWCLLHDAAEGEDNRAIRIADIQNIDFKGDVCTYKLATWDYACVVEFVPGEVCDDNGGPLAWAMFDAVITHGFKGSDT